MKAKRVINNKQLTAIVKRCYVGRRASYWIDVDKLCAEVNYSARELRATTPNSLADCIATAEKKIADGAPLFVKSAEKLGELFGVQRQTLYHWDACGVICLYKHLGGYDVATIIEELKKWESYTKTHPRTQ